MMTYAVLLFDLLDCPLLSSLVTNSPLAISCHYWEVKHGVKAA